MNVLDLFSGIGGFSLGLERAGMHTVAFCECDPYARRVLAKHWPGVFIHDDVRTLTAVRLAADGISVDVICGGFPCQDISAAGRGAGIDGAKSGLWREYARLVREVRPQWVIVENSPVLRTRGADRVLGDLEAEGYTCEPCVVGAAHAGAPHRRARIFIFAYADRKQHQSGGASIGWAEGKVVSADPDCAGLEIAVARPTGQQPAIVGGGVLYRDAAGFGLVGAGARPNEGGFGRLTHSGWWAVEPDVGRVAHGVPARVDRLKCLGNAVVPAIPEMIGRAIMQAGA